MKQVTLGIVLLSAALPGLSGWIAATSPLEPTAVPSYNAKSAPPGISLERGTQQEVLQRLPVNSAGDLEYQLVIARCDTAPCPIGISLVRDGRLLSSVELIKGRSPQPRFTTDDGYAWDDPLFRTEVSYWEIGFARSGQPPYGVAIYPTTVRLEPDLNGILVTQALHTHHGTMHRHKLLLAEGDSLREVWGATNVQFGPNTFRWSVARVFELDEDGTQGVLHLSLEDQSYAGEMFETEMYDQWDVSTYRWNPATRDLDEVAESDRPPLYAVIVGSYETVEEAREKFGEFNTGDVGNSCLIRFWVVRSDWFPLLRPGWSIVAALSSSQEAVLEVLEKAKACNTSLDGYLRRAQ